MRVMKFGGGCLMNSGDILRVARMAAAPGTVVVVSALHGVTDALKAAIASAVSRGRVPEKTLRILHARHSGYLNMIFNGAPPAACASRIGKRFDELERILRGISCIGEAADSSKARVLSYGERFSAEIVAAAITSMGCAAQARDSAAIGIMADRAGTSARIDIRSTRPRLRRNLLSGIRAGVIPVITGFFGRAPDGSLATFGRNASDYSAAVVACALDAQELIIWKSVAGIMTTDPSTDSEARTVHRISWDEVGELTHLGAHILHPQTLEPLQKRRTRVHIRNIHAPENGGTEIVPDEMAGDEVCGISCLRAASILSLRIRPGSLHRVLPRMGEILRLPVERITSLISARDRMTLILSARDARRARRALAETGDTDIHIQDIQHDRAMVAVVGRGLRNSRGLANLMDALASAQITIDAIAPGTSLKSLGFVIPDLQADRCLKAIHRRFFPLPTPSAPASPPIGDLP